MMDHRRWLGLNASLGSFAIPLPPNAVHAPTVTQGRLADVMPIMLGAVACRISGRNSPRQVGAHARKPEGLAWRKLGGLCEAQPFRPERFRCVV